MRGHFLGREVASWLPRSAGVTVAAAGSTRERGPDHSGEPEDVVRAVVPDSSRHHSIA